MSVVAVSEAVNDTGRRWNFPGAPHRGWSLVDVDDLEEPEGECQMCGQQEVRYIHTVRHPDYEGTLDVGCDCCERMTEDYVNPRERERTLRNRAARRRNWLKRSWRVSRNGNAFIKFKGHHVVVFPWGPAWRFRLNGALSVSNYPTQDAAKLGAFDTLWPASVRAGLTPASGAPIL